MVEPGSAQRRLAAIVVADVVGYTRLIERDDAGTLSKLREIRDQLIDPALRAYGGHVVRLVGDGMLLEFGSADAALRWSIEVQRGLAQRNAPLAPDERVQYRIGINLGDIMDEGSDIAGDGVNVAARLEGLAEPGGICVSGVVREQVHGALSVGFDDIGLQRVKNIARPIQAYRLGLAGAAAKIAPTPTLALPDKPSIAVLPFQNMSGDLEQEYFADAIAEGLVTALSCWRSFFVIARDSSFTYKGRAVDVRRVGAELGIRYVMKGSVQKVGERVRITAQLLETLNGTHIWADKFDRQLVDILALQDEITQRVVNAIEPALLRTENVQIGGKSLNDYTALDCYQRGMWHLNKVSEEGYRKAIELFRKAIDCDPQLSLGYVGLSRILYGGGIIYGWSEHPDEDLRQSLAAAEKAISLDSADAYAHFAFSGAALYLGAHQQALEAARRAIALNPNFAYGHLRFGQVLIYSGHPTDAIKPIERSLRHSPIDPQLGAMLAALALARYQARDYAEAVVQARAAIQQNLALGSMLLAAALARLGRIDEARKALPGDLLARLNRDSPRLASYANEADRDHFLGGLHLAGVGVASPTQTASQFGALSRIDDRLGNDPSARA